MPGVPPCTSRKCVGIELRSWIVAEGVLEVAAGLLQLLLPVVMLAGQERTPVEMIASTSSMAMVVMKRSCRCRCGRLAEVRNADPPLGPLLEAVTSDRSHGRDMVAWLSPAAQQLQVRPAELLKAVPEPSGKCSSKKQRSP